MAEAVFQTGGWINWSKGLALGATLTVTARDGQFLVAFLALFVRSAGSSVWNIIRFLLHQRRSKSQPQDGLYHQQQATLRNNTSHTGTLWQMAKLSWFWRSNAEGGMWRSMPIMMLAIFHIVAFTVAGIFSSRVATTNDEILIRSPACGYFMFPNVNLTDLNETTYDAVNAELINERRMLLRSSNYAQLCYNQPSGTSSCDVYTTQYINSTVDVTAPCPFAEILCYQQDGGTIQLDSGLIDSDLDLGINAPKGDRVQYRRVTTCAPINTEGFVGDGWVEGTSSNSALPGDKFVHYYYGHQLDSDGHPTNNFTYSHSNYSDILASQPYVLDYQGALLGSDILSTFHPIPDLNRTDADVSLIFLDSNAQYTRPVSDIWFMATTEASNIDGLGGNNYIPDQAVSVMGCTEQYQLCNPSLPSSTGCTPLTGRLVLDYTTIGLNTRQVAAATRLYTTISSNTLSNIIYDLGSTSLLAQSYLDGAQTLSAAVPANEWTLEVENWHSIILANLQRQTISFASGPVDAANNKYITYPPTPEEAAMCLAQKARNPNATCFSILGLAIILVVGSVFIAVDLALAPLVGVVQRLTNKGLYQRLEWMQGESLQLQRVAFEGAGVGTWRGAEDLVPVTGLGEKFCLPMGGVAVQEGQEGGYQYEALTKGEGGTTVRAI